ncbi:MAG TPA: hypothetical protein VJ046_00720, partial [Candidatus Paceibacterota bacterium]|nr:hypothetical protein [Candidatus Paceibacterota bacterium]
MAERISPTERPVSPEKSREEVYAEALRTKRDVLSSHHAMDSLRREVNERIDEMSDEEFKQDPEVAKYGKVSKEYNKRRKLFLDSLEGLSDEDKEKIGGLTSLTKVEVELSSLAGEEEEERPESLKQTVFEKSERDITADEVNNMIEYSQRTGRLLELAYWEAKKQELEEREDAEASPDQTPPKGFVQRVKSAFAKPEEVSAEAEPKKPTKWGWFKERAKGVWNFGIWEFHQAERFRSKTREVANEAKALATLIQEERDMTPEAAEKEAWEIVDELNSKGLDISAPEFYPVASEISEEKRKENDEEIEYIITTASSELLDKLQKYRGEAGQDVLTEENKKAFQEDLRAQLNKSRDGFLKQYTVDLAEVMRRNLDENWWRRYIWGTAEAALGFAGVKFLTVKAADWWAAAKMAKAAEGAEAAKDFVMQGMNENVWHTLDQMAQNGPKHLNLDPAELKSLAQKVLETNGMFESEWTNSLTEGLRSSRALPQGLPLKIPTEVMAFLG